MKCQDIIQDFVKKFLQFPESFQYLIDTKMVFEDGTIMGNKGSGKNINQQISGWTRKCLTRQLHLSHFNGF